MALTELKLGWRSWVRPLRRSVFPGLLVLWAVVRLLPPRTYLAPGVDEGC